MRGEGCFQRDKNNFYFVQTDGSIGARDTVGPGYGVLTPETVTAANLESANPLVLTLSQVLGNGLIIPLSELNDEWNYTFEQIAEVIEKSL